MKFLKIAGALALAISLSGCAGLTYKAVSFLYGDSPAQRDAVKAVAISMAAYDKGVQPQIERYMRWPKRGTPECVAVKVSLLCRDQAVAARLVQADGIASAAIHKARQVIDGVVEDDGTALTDAAAAMRDAEATFLMTVPEAKP